MSSPGSPNQPPPKLQQQPYQNTRAKSMNFSKKHTTMTHLIPPRNPLRQNLLSKRLTLLFMNRRSKMKLFRSRTKSHTKQQLRTRFRKIFLKRQSNNLCSITKRSSRSQKSRWQKRMKDIQRFKTSLSHPWKSMGRRM